VANVNLHAGMVLRGDQLVRPGAAKEGRRVASG
jgi:hypothetical protein